MYLYFVPHTSAFYGCLRVDSRKNLKGDWIWSRVIPSYSRISQLYDLLFTCNQLREFYYPFFTHFNALELLSYFRLTQPGKQTSRQALSTSISVLMFINTSQEQLAMECRDIAVPFVSLTDFLNEKIPKFFTYFYVE